MSMVGVSLFLLAGCAPSIGLVRENFDSHESLVARLDDLHRAHSEIMSLESIGTTHEGRSILAVRIAGPHLDEENAPALLAIFGEHGDEHDVIDLGVGMVTYLAAYYGADSKITRLLDQNVVWIIPMMNPDGAEFDLSGSVEPFTWRKNRRPTSDSTRAWT